MSAIEAAIEKIPGVVGVAVKHLESGKAIRHNADEVFFTASTFKVPLLVELYRQVDAGKVGIDDRVELTDELRVTGSGVLKELDKGLQPTIHDLATLMIIVSDNTATDILYNLVGGDNLAKMLADLGLHQTSIPMTTRELLYSVVGLDVYNPTHTYQMAADKHFLNQLVLDADGFSEERSDVSSPSDMARLLEMVHRGDVLSAASREGFFDIMKRQQLNNVIGSTLPVGTEAAHKTGSYHSVQCDVGIVYSPTGPYTVALMAKQVEGPRLEVHLAMAELSRVIYDQMVA